MVPKDEQSRDTFKPRPRGRPPGPPTEVMSIRIPEELAERIRVAQKDAVAAANGAAIPLSSFLSMVITRGLDALEASKARRSARREEKTLEMAPSAVRQAQVGMMRVKDEED